ncbi:MAG: DNA-binding response OmpR family regulator [Paraglaciecola sp.]|jgi:DNA-binding response OmpR family regulator
MLAAEDKFMETVKSRILIADDEPALLSIMQTLLDPHFDVMVAVDGQTAMDLIESQQFLFLILDIHLPHMSGLDICQCILDSKLLPKPHIVILSGDSSHDSIRSAYGMNIDDYIIKPITALAFLERMLRLERDILDFTQMHNLGEKTRNMAETAMQQASEYGSALELISRLNSIADSQQLAKEVAVYFRSKGYFSAIQLRKENDSVNFDIDTNECSEVELKIFFVLHKHGRIYNFGRRTIFNDDHVSVLIKNMPQGNSQAYGMLIDIAAKLVPAINSRFISLCNEHAINQGIDTLTTAMQMVGAGITAMEMEKRSIIQDVITHISGSFHELELTDKQEQYFIALIENQLQKNEVSNEFLHVKETLNSCLSSITSTQNMKKTTAQVAQSEYQDVELF